MTGLVLNFESVGDAKPEETIRSMSNVSRALNVVTTFNVNGTLVTIDPKDAQDAAIAFYRRQQARMPGRRSLAIIDGAKP